MSRPVRSGETRLISSWPLVILAAPAFVAVWSGWVGLGALTGFGDVRPLPGIADDFTINSAITLPVGVETYAAYALRVWLSARMPPAARRFARWSAIGSLTLGAAGQMAYHLMTAAHVRQAPWQITTVVACLPVAVLGMGAALAHLLHAEQPVSHPVAEPVEQPEASADNAPEHDTVDAPDTTTDVERTRARTASGTSRRTGKPDTASNVARLRRRYPEMSTTDIARRLGVTDRTVRRHLAPRATDEPHRADQASPVDLVRPVEQTSPADVVRPVEQPRPATAPAAVAA